MLATYTKLKNGNWGVRVKCEDPFEEFPENGTQVTVTKKSGETSQRTVTSVVWEGEDDGLPVRLYALD